jgi:PHD/YefM family antitoxin component YafN of YafNO toxin-antitoxin module
MSIDEIMSAVQYVVDSEGQQTAVLLDLNTWKSLQLLLQDIVEDERLGRLMAEVENEESLLREAALSGA